ncbi:hypothetical protein [Candidatus Rariloculus sp.]|uniref:hypothetical protein n=1 Tax=Candidatus Rariloculus sp. TaxID=3101265 RepID=UPI003D1261BF
MTILAWLLESGETEPFKLVEETPANTRVRNGSSPAMTAPGTMIAAPGLPLSADSSVCFSGVSDLPMAAGSESGSAQVERNVACVARGKDHES